MTIEIKAKEALAKIRFCLAIDHVSAPQEALDIARELSDVAGTIKVGSTLHTRAGREGVPIVTRIFEGGTRVFLDLKYHDTPDQVYGSARESAYAGVFMFNTHIAGGERACKEALRGAHDGAELHKVNRPLVIGVTELTSIEDEDLAKQGLNTTYDALVLKRAEQAREWGLDGIVCPASKAGELEKRFGRWLYVTPGIKYGGVQNVGQKQLDTPDGAVQACQSSILVIGSAVFGTKKDPIPREQWRNRAYEILQVMAKHL